MRTVLIVAAVVLMASPAAAQAPGQCSKFAEAIETGQRNLAYTHARSFADDTVEQASHRAAQEANVLALIRLNVDLAMQNRCPAPPAPITRGGYEAYAKACTRAKGDADIAAKCSGWKFDPDAPEPAVDGN